MKSFVIALASTELFITNKIVSANFICSCPDGYPKSGSECKFDGHVQCASCQDGYKLYGRWLSGPEYPDNRLFESYCSPVQCTEPGPECLEAYDGSYSNGQYCPKNNIKSCRICKDGYHVVHYVTENPDGDGNYLQGRCQTNVCTCENGDPATGSECLSNNSPTCSECNEGYHLDENKACVQNQCYCENGDPATGLDCLTNQSQTCSECFDSYHLDENKTCVQNQCYCDFGEEATNALCSEHDSHQCAVCEAGLLFKVDNVCKPVDSDIANYTETTADCDRNENSAVKCMHVKHSISSSDGIQSLVSQTLAIFGIDAVSLPEQATSGRKKRQANDPVSILSSYGCWCSKAFTGAAAGGTPVDDLDTVCRDWSQCHFCERVSECEGDLLDDYTLVLDSNSRNYTCASSSECAEQRCQCEGRFAMNLALHLESVGSVLDSSLVAIDESQCVKPIQDVLPNNACCGVAPTWIAYNSDANICDDGNVL